MRGSKNLDGDVRMNFILLWHVIRCFESFDINLAVTAPFISVITFDFISLQINES